MARIYENSVPGKTEQELWAELHFENARSGGEWLETRLLTCGAHTNPWYSECSDRICRAGEMIAFDTDMTANHSVAGANKSRFTHFADIAILPPGPDLL